jgi:hypothetical protein
MQSLARFGKILAGHYAATQARGYTRGFRVIDRGPHAIHAFAAGMYDSRGCEQNVQNNHDLVPKPLRIQTFLPTQYMDAGHYPAHLGCDRAYEGFAYIRTPGEPDDRFGSALQSVVDRGAHLEPALAQPLADDPQRLILEARVRARTILAR